MKHYLITGAAGFIGSQLVEVLLHSGHRVTGIDNFSLGTRAHIAKSRLRRTPLSFIFTARFEKI